ncbi:hypothetical protein BX616_000309 [Lobosporangium transversale]|nr:hypothetical protein BX616_000309 [Lobosporangium transversale]
MNYDSNRGQGDGKKVTSIPIDRSEQDARIMTGRKVGKSKYLPCFPCIISTCGRISCCLLILIVLIIGSLAIVVATNSRAPTINYLGPVGNPEFSFNKGNTTLAMTVIANFEINNTNSLLGYSIDAADITAYYPGYEPALGTGNVRKTHVPSRSTVITQVPITIGYDRHQDSPLFVVRSILSICGLSGDTNAQITINYEAQAAIKVLGFVSIPFTIKDKSYSIRDILKNIGDEAKDIISDIGGFIEDVGDRVGDVIGDFLP